MRICFIAEGCYPYVVGGVSSWVHSMIKNFPNQEFILLTIVANRDASGKFAYELPENVTEVHEVYLEDVDWGSVNRHNKTRLNKKEYQALRSLILNHEVEWDNVFEFFHKKNISLNQLLMGEDFYHAVLDAYNLQYPDIVFSDFLLTMRSMYLPDDRNPQSGCVSCGGNRICRGSWKYGKIFSFRSAYYFRTWNLYQRTRRRTDKSRMGTESL